MQHLDEGTIHAWLDGALSVEAAGLAEAHIALCSACADAVAEARGLIAASSRILTALDNVPNVRGAGEAQEKRWKGAGSRRSITTWLVRERIAAVMALVVAGGALAVVLSRPGSQAANVELAAEPVRTFEVAAADSPAPPPAPAQALRDGGRATIGAGTAVAPASPVRARDLTATRQADASAPAAAVAEQAAPTVTSNAVVTASRTVDSVPPMRVAEAQREEAAERLPEGKSSVAEKVAGGLARRRAAETPTAFAGPRSVGSSIGGVGGAASAQSAAAPSAGPRLVQEETMRDGGREVRRRIYLVENVLVTLDERLPSALNEMRAPSAHAQPDSVQGITAITWTAANGTELTLTGPATKERLERIRKVLGY